MTTAYFNDVPVRPLAYRHLAGEWCVLVEWPNGNRSWLAQHEVYTRPRSA